MERHGSSVDVGSFLGAEVPRVFAKGFAEGGATPAELDTMRRVVRDAVRDIPISCRSACVTCS
jgi:N-acyl-D-amino-acid deacylase